MRSLNRTVSVIVPPQPVSGVPTPTLSQRTELPENYSDRMEDEGWTSKEGAPGGCLLRGRCVLVCLVPGKEFNPCPLRMESADTGACSYLEDLTERSWLECLWTAGQEEKAGMKKAAFAPTVGGGDMFPKG